MRMTDEELQDLAIIGKQGGSYRSLLCFKAWQEIEWLEEQRCNLVAYIADLKSSHAMLYVSRKMDGPL